MYSSILLAVDSSPFAQWARKAALSLAEKGARINLLHVIDIVALEGTFLQDLSGAIGVEPYMSLSPKLERILKEKGEALLEAHEKAVREAGFECRAEMVSGIIANEIARKANETELVVIGQRGSNAKFHAGLAGSVSEALLRKSPRPVVVVPAEPADRLTRITLAYDGSEPASRALPEAARLCREGNLPLKVVSVADEQGEAEKTLDGARHFFEGADYPVTYEAHKGEPSLILRDASRNSDLLIAGAHGHSRLVEFVVGSTTEFLLRNTHCPTLFVR